MTAPITSEMWTRIVAELAGRLKTPSDDIPNVQWLSETHLQRLLVTVAKTVGAPTSLSGRTLLVMLAESKLAQKLTIEDVPDGKKPYSVYSLELGCTPSISPIELLQSTQASYERTVICYSTAIEYHQLTTQETPHHHVSSLKRANRQEDGAPARTAYSGEDATTSKTVRPPSLGTLLFRYAGIPYYVTYRDPSLMPGIQTVRLSPSCRIRMTTLEQTLLDTLHRPWNCGGPPVVFEAWERGLPVLDDSRLSQCLRKIGRSDFTRRVGYMLEQFGHAAADNDLCTLLAEAKVKVKSGTEPGIPLLPDVPSSVGNETWGVFI